MMLAALRRVPDVHGHRRRRALFGALGAAIRAASRPHARASSASAISARGWREFAPRVSHAGARLRSGAATKRRSERGAEKVDDLQALLAASDAVSLHLPLTAETRHIIGRDELRAMKPTAVLVNAARGPLIDEAALAEALRERIAGAALDVFEVEPPAPDNPILTAPNIVLSPHTAGNTVEAARISRAAHRPISSSRSLRAVVRRASQSGSVGEARRDSSRVPVRWHREAAVLFMARPWKAEEEGERSCGTGKSRDRYRHARSAVQRLLRGPCPGRAPVDRRALGGGSGLVRGGALPDLVRHPEQPHDAADRSRRSGLRLPRALQQFQRQHRRQPGPARQLRAPDAARHAHRDRRHRSPCSPTNGRASASTRRTTRW